VLFVMRFVANSYLVMTPTN